MRHRLTESRDGAAAVEFALLLPVLLIIVFGSVALGLALLNANALKGLTTEVARCLAISGPACTSAAPSCGDTAAICYILSLARNRGFSRISTSNIVIDTNGLSGGVSITEVTLTYQYQLLGYSLALSERGSFPNL